MLREARLTTGQLAQHAGQSLEQSRGEPAFVFQHLGRTLAVVLERVGTKSVLTRQYQEQTGAASTRRGPTMVWPPSSTIWSASARCRWSSTRISPPAAPSGTGTRIGCSGLLGAGGDACLEAGATWGGGESPSLPDRVASEEIEIAGCAVGSVPQGQQPILGQDLADGEVIMLVASSGLHANGASIARRLAAGLPEGLRIRLASGACFGAALLRPTRIYARLVSSLLDRNLAITYLSHISGHGLRKLMRPARELTYRRPASFRRPRPAWLAFVAGAAGPWSRWRSSSASGIRNASHSCSASRHARRASPRRPAPRSASPRPRSAMAWPQRSPSSWNSASACWWWASASG